MKYLFLDTFAFLSPAMLAAALYDMTKNRDTLEKICASVCDIIINETEEKRCGMEARFLRLGYSPEKEKITKPELDGMCEKLNVCENTKEKLKEYIRITADAKSIDADTSEFDAKTATDCLIFAAYAFETVLSLEAEKVYVSKILIPSDDICTDEFSEKISNAIYIMKKHNISHTVSPVCAPSFSEEWAAMCAVLNASPKATHSGDIIKIGYGAGEDDTQTLPNILRAVYGEENEADLLFEAESAVGLNFV